MRTALIAGFVVAFSLMLFAYVAWNVFGFEETREYESYAVAAADNVFAGGWLPELVPASATRLVMFRDFDVYIGRGEFHYDPADTAAFVSELRPWQGGRTPFGDFAARVAAMEQRGFRAYEFTGAGNVWLFLVNAAEGRVEYDMWRDAAYPREGAAAPP